MTQKPSPRLQLHSAEDLFEKLKWEEKRLEQSWSEYDSFNFIVTAHHLYFDWILRGNAATPEQVDRAKNLPPSAKLVFQVITDVSNGSKHWTLEHPGSKQRQVVVEVTEPICAGYDSYFFGDMVYFRFDGYFASMAEVSSLVMQYFDWILNGSSELSLDELTAALEGMRMAQETGT